MNKEKIKKNPNWKQWIPVYGLYQATIDHINGKPSVINIINYPVLSALSVAYQSITTPAVLLIAENALEKLLK
ncbi:MAG: hypothetical protein AABY32_03625 [Nanoarchaeota archaeon]